MTYENYCLHLSVELIAQNKRVLNKHINLCAHVQTRQNFPSVPSICWYHKGTHIYSHAKWCCYTSKLLFIQLKQHNIHTVYTRISIHPIHTGLLPG